MSESGGAQAQLSGPPPTKDGVDYINVGEEDQMEVYGYQRHVVYSVVTWLFIILTGGILRLVFHWQPRWMLYATHKKCSLEVAEKVLVVEMFQRKYKCYYVKEICTLTAQNVITQKSEKKPENVENSAQNDQVLVEMGASSREKLSVHLSGGIFKEVSALRMFNCKKLRYIWDPESGEFLKLCGLDKNVRTATLHCQGGVSVREQMLRRVVYGCNEIVVPVRGVLTLLFLEVLNPFYVFQLFSFCLWFADNYIYYAMAILVMSAFGISMAIIQTRRNQQNLQSTVHSSDVATVVRGESGLTETVPTELLVPGDLLVVPPHGCVMHCDAVLLMGNCIVNESMLTGESVPVTKIPLPNSQDVIYDSKEHSRHTLFCGTHVLQTRYYGSERVLAVVIRTGFSTAKGNLVRSIMYPPPVDFKFERDSYRFVELLAGIASIGFAYTVITKYLRGISVSEIALDSLDLITIVVPPALPAAMTVGRFYAQHRLRAKNVYCISPRSINVSGSIDCVCFDKTGTLTEDGLDMWGVVPSVDRKFQVPVKYIDKMDYDELLLGMVTCHSLTIIDGKLSGDPLDLKMFEATGWFLEEPEVHDNSKFDMIFPTVVKPPPNSVTRNIPDDHIGCGDDSTLQMEEFLPPLEIGIVRQFPFSSSIQRMSVITRKLGDTHFNVYCKGSPEMIVSLSRPNTIPEDFSSVLEEYTQEGYRVLGIGFKALPKISYTKVQRISRDDVESSLTFLGLIIMENRLKPETTGIITMLRNADIRTVMVTGDNMLTALSVARDCGIISHGQRVIEVHSIASPVQQPQLVFTNSTYSMPPPLKPTASVGGIGITSSDSKAAVIGAESINGTVVGISPSNDLKKTLGDSQYSSNYCFSMTGRTWSLAKSFEPDLISKLATRGAVFARMSPDQKQQLVQELQSLGYYVAMCGDGANDCGALKAAHTGISLSEAESSVASPFTSKEPNISCVPRVIREGRAALVTSFGIFKYMAAYSLTQFVSVMMLYSIDSNLTDIEFLYIDLFIITVFAFFFGKTEAFEGPLVKQAPILSLISLTPILSLLLQLGAVIVFQWGAFYTVHQMPWFIPYNATASESVGCYENYALFSVSSMQYIILALVFSKGAPYRKSVFNNYGFLISLIVLTAMTIYLTIDPLYWLQDIFELKMPPDMDFRLVMLAFGLGNLVFAFLVEDGFVDYLVFQKCRKKYHNPEKSRRKFLVIDSQLKKDSCWPPLSSKSALESVIPSQTKIPPPRALVSEIHVECETNACNGNVPNVCLPQASVSDTAEDRSNPLPCVEVTLDPASLVQMKRRYNSESEHYGSMQVTDPSLFLENGFATLPRQKNLKKVGHSAVDLKNEVTTGSPVQLNPV